MKFYLSNAARGRRAGGASLKRIKEGAENLVHMTWHIEALPQCLGIENRLALYIYTSIPFISFLRERERGGKHLFCSLSGSPPFNRAMKKRVSNRCAHGGFDLFIRAENKQASKKK